MMETINEINIEMAVVLMNCSLNIGGFVISYGIGSYIPPSCYSV